MLRIIQITDFHLFADAEGTLKGINTLNGLGVVVRDCRLKFPAPDLVLVTGDVSHDGSAASYRQCRDMLAGLSAPVMFIPGNHDDVAIMQQQLPGGNISPGRYLQIRGWNIILLDTVMRGEESGFLAVDELAFLDDMLQNWPDCPALVALHHPPVAVGSHWIDAIGLANSEEFFDVLDRYPQVRGVVFGHVHQGFEGRHGPVRLLASPSSCIQFKPGCDTFALDDAGPGYRCLQLYPDGRIETEVIRTA